MQAHGQTILQSLHASDKVGEPLAKMTDPTPNDPPTSGEDESVTFHVKSNQAKWTLNLPLSTTTIDLKNKLAQTEYANVPAASQRLIYSGRVLKDDDTLLSHKVKEGNTMHLVKSAPSNQRQNPGSQSTSAAAVTPSSTTQATGVPQNIAAGTGNDPFAALTGARYAGFSQLPSADMFGADGGMGPPPSIESMTEMLSNPNFAQMMNEALQNPQLVDMMIQQNPQLRAMGPQARQMLQSDQFRQMITNPQALQQMAQLSRTMGMGPFGGGGGESAFPMPGATNTTPAENRDAGATPSAGTGGTAQPNPFASLLGAGGAGANPFAAFMNPPQTNSSTLRDTPSAPTGTSGAQNPPNPFAMLFNPALMGQGTNPANNPPANPFQNSPLFQDPAAMATLMQAMGGAGGGVGADGNANAMQNLMNLLGGAPPQPTDTRPPEERYATQLRQLNEMGFFEFERNIQALTRSGGDVNGALEWLFSQPS